jgi:hypothetical protein
VWSIGPSIRLSLGFSKEGRGQILHGVALVLDLRLDLLGPAVGVVRQAEDDALGRVILVVELLLGVILAPLLRRAYRVKELGPAFVVEKCLAGRVEGHRKPGNGVGPPPLQLPGDDRAAPLPERIETARADDPLLDDALSLLDFRDLLLDFLAVRKDPGVVLGVAVLEVDIDVGLQQLDGLEFQWSTASVLLGFGHGARIAHQPFST